MVWPWSHHPSLQNHPKAGLFQQSNKSTNLFDTQPHLFYICPTQSGDINKATVQELPAVPSGDSVSGFNNSKILAANDRDKGKGLIHYESDQDVQD